MLRCPGAVREEELTMEYQKIDWEKIVGSNYIKLQNGVPTVLRLSNWRPQTTFKDEKTQQIKEGVEFDCVEQDGKLLIGDDQRSYIVTAATALRKLRPIVEKAQAAGKNSIHVRIFRAGEGKSTIYEIVDLAGMSPLNESKV